MCFHKYLSCKHADQCIGPVITPLLCGVCVEASLMPQMVKNLPTVQADSLPTEQYIILYATGVPYGDSQGLKAIFHL